MHVQVLDICDMLPHIGIKIYPAQRRPIILVVYDQRDRNPSRSANLFLQVYHEGLSDTLALMVRMHSERMQFPSIPIMFRTTTNLA